MNTFVPSLTENLFMRRIGWCACLTFLVVPAFAQERLTLDALACKRFCELEQIYRTLSPGTLPQGFLRGRVVYSPCESLPGPREKLNNFAWKGKHFHGDGLINQFRGVKCIKACIYLGDSWLDGKQAHILDYENTSLAWRDVRDEMREVGDGLYLGAMYLRRCPQPRLKVMFILERECGGCVK